MTSIGNRIITSTVSTAVNALGHSTVGAFFGYVYAKLADLPAGDVAKAWAV